MRGRKNNFGNEKRNYCFYIFSPVFGYLVDLTAFNALCEFYLCYDWNLLVKKFFLLILGVVGAILATMASHGIYLVIGKVYF